VSGNAIYLETEHKLIVIRTESLVQKHTRVTCTRGVNKQKHCSGTSLASFSLYARGFSPRILRTVSPFEKRINRRSLSRRTRRESTWLARYLRLRLRRESRNGANNSRPIAIYPSIASRCRAALFSIGSARSLYARVHDASVSLESER